MPGEVEQESSRTRSSVAVVVFAATVVLIAAAAVIAWDPLHLTRMGESTVRLGDEPVSVLVADTPQRRAWGLQGRTALPEGRGMLFVYDPPHVATFEIKSVPFPLDVVFVGAGTRVTRVVPLDATHPTAASPSSVGYVLELPGGWCERHGVAVGTRMSLSAR